MSGINVKDAMEAQSVLSITKQFVKTPSPNADGFRLRSSMLRDMADDITRMANNDVKDMPKELVQRYNTLVETLYEVSDLEYDLYKAYR